MRVLMLTRDPRSLDPTSNTARRFAAYRAEVEDLNVLYLSPRTIFSLVGAFRGSYDLVTSPDPFETGLIAYALSRRLRIPLELQVHTDLWSPWYAAESFINRMRLKMASWLLPRASCVRVVSLRIKRGIVERLVPARGMRWNISILPIYPHLSPAERSASSAVREHYAQFKVVALVLSRLSKEKNIPMILRSFAHVVSKFPDTGLLVVGSGPEEKRLRNLSRELGVQDNVVFIPWTYDSAPYFASADIFLSASDYEGYGLTLLEAAAAGCPILSTDVGCVGEALPYEAVTSVAPRDEEAFLNAFIGLVAFPEARKRTVDAGREAVKRIGTFADFIEKMVTAWKTCG